MKVITKRLFGNAMCPKCGMAINGVTNLNLAATGPRKLTGKASMCMDCGVYLVFIDEDGNARLMSDVEQASGEYAHSVARMKEIWREIQKIREELTNAFSS